MRAHKLRLRLYTDRPRAVRSPWRRVARAAALASALALTAGTALVLLPAAASAEECSNTAFRTGSSAHLPDCRAYEMVTPPYKNSGFGRPVVISPSGLSMQMFVDGGYAGIEGYPNIIIPLPGELYTTRRTPSGWVSTPDDLPSSEYLPFLQSGFANWGFSDEEGLDNQMSVWMDRGSEQPDNRVNLFMRRADRSIVNIGPALPPTAPTESLSELGTNSGLLSDAPSGNGSRFFFATNRYHWPFDSTLEGRASLYEYVGTGNTAPLLVGVNDSGALISQCGVALGEGSSQSGEPSSGHNDVSTDGDTVFFTAGAKEPGCSGPPVGELYARIDNGLHDAHTVAISEPSKEDCSACDTEAGVLADAHFDGASEDGSKVFFTTTQPLLDSATSNNLYEYDFDAPAGERVARATAGDATVSHPSPGLVRMVGRTPVNSEDGSHVYFVAIGVLTTAPNGEGESAQPGTDNLYVFERDAGFPGGHIAFVAGLSEGDMSEAGGWAPEATPDGRFLVFASERDLTPDDTSTARQIFEYDAQTGALVRVSIGQGGFNNNGNRSAKARNIHGILPNAASILSPAVAITGSFEGSQPVGYWSHLSVSADGSYIFFQSTVGLTPEAFDEREVTEYLGEPVYANNIYEYHDGRVSLISDGQDLSSLSFLSNVELLGTDASGKDVFFQTVDHLVGQDTDTGLDIYDARVNGGFPASALPQQCSGESCQGPLSGAPTLLSPGSEFQAGGNPPLAGEPAAKPKPKPKSKAKKRRPKGGKAGKGHSKRRGVKAKGAATRGLAKRKAGRS